VASEGQQWDATKQPGKNDNYLEFESAGIPEGENVFNGSEAVLVSPKHDVTLARKLLLFL